MFSSEPLGGVSTTDRENFRGESENILRSDFYFMSPAFFRVL
jgi:hypothetical protein